MKILVVDDEATQAGLLAGALRAEGHDAVAFSLPEKALEALAASGADLLITDHRMPRMTGLELIQKALGIDPGLLAIIVTAYGTVEDAVLAMKAGAFDYLTKPVDLDHLLLLVEKARTRHDLVRENQELKKSLERYGRVQSIIGDSPAMREVFSKIHRVAPTDATVLITGESGTGKELVAQAIHRASPRATGPFVAVNCAALAETLLESELFGHEKGAFTGAAFLKKGRFELADGGTLFLDEIGELSLPLQVKLLRVLQEKVFERVGGVKPISVNIRLIAATNRKLREEMLRGRFREDLFYRLNVVQVTLPPLRERPEDLRLLISHFLQKYQNIRLSGAPVTSVDPEVERLFLEYHWPGNVRELENAIERAIILCPSDTISVSDLPRDFKQSISNTLHIEGIPADATLHDALTMVEKSMIKRALKMADNVQSHAADILGIGKSGLSQKLKKFGMEQGSRD